MSSIKIPRQIQYVSYTEKNGYAWEKRVAGKLLWVSLKTKDVNVAQRRAVALTVRYIQLKPFNLTLEALRETLRAYRDGLADQAMLEALGIIQNIEPLTTASNDVEAQICSPNHLISDVLEEWVADMKTEWKPRTEKLNRKGVELFIEWAIKRNISHVEDVNKQVVSHYKEWLLTRYEAPRSRQDALIKLQALFGFCINKRDWITSNPVRGMLFNKVESINTKSEIAPDVYEAVLKSEYTQSYKGMLIPLLMILWNTGMRIGEAIQLRPEDFREIDGIKCISINTENGKTVKCDSSIRNIPITSHLNELYEDRRALPEGEKVLGWNKNNAAASRVANAFKKLGFDHSTHDFRMTLSNRLRDIEVADSVRYAILGHSNTVTTDRVYQTRKPLIQMQKALEKVC
ncbi:tyrosine-type recombinase/integrase [Enterobacter hormaechei]|nr:tyrosine-type recombinase/integrase [Enterobacter hormaechei]MBT1821222.1 tyrosine-type recombinase/integrase [Enterobacter hormaechei]